MAIPYICTAEVLECISIKDIIPLMHDLFYQHALTSYNSYRHIMKLNNPEGLTLLMPAFHEQAHSLGVKISSIRPHNIGLPIVNGLYVLLDYITGKPKAIIDSNIITQFRTAAITAVVTKASLGDTQNHTLGIIGAGVQAFSHAQALCHSLSINALQIFSRTPEKAYEMARKIKDLPWAPPLIKVSNSLKDAIENVSVLCMCTSTATIQPLIKVKDLPTSIRHINAIGGRTIDALEIDPALYQNANVIVESIDEAIQDSGEIRKALADGIIDKSKISTITDLLTGSQSDAPLSIYRSVGLAIEDLFLAEYIFSTVTAKHKETLLPSATNIIQEEKRDNIELM